MNDPILRCLEVARSKIEAEAAWIKRNAGRTAAGHVVAPNHPLASCFCIAGALNAAAYDIGGPEFVEACAAYVRRVIMDTTPFDFITQFNDNPKTTHAEVLDVMDKAITRRREVLNGPALQLA